MEDLLAIIERSPLLNEIFSVLREFASEDLFIGAGSIAQTVWNYKFGKDLTYGISDIDIVFYNGNDLTGNYEISVFNQVAGLMPSFPLRIDMKNQARVHLWYPAKFGSAIKPVTSIEDAVSRWPTTSTSVAINIRTGSVIAPFGLDDLFSCTVRPNKTQVSRDIYISKVEKWMKLWPGLVIIPW